MSATITYLTNFQNKVFKLLPMREDYDNGADNHLDEYLDSLCLNYSGALVCYPLFSSTKELVEVQSNLSFLKNTSDIDFAKWRRTVLKSVRLIDNAIKKIPREA